MVRIPKSIWKGWWEQVGSGRQPMQETTFTFDRGEIHGQGHDIVGIFIFTGVYDEAGHVKMVKKYLGAHEVYYEGHFDGEGTILGMWNMSYMPEPYDKGKFAITMQLEINHNAPIETINPK
jgi:hypothetical protein